MSDYHVNLPGDLLLTVEVKDDPIRMHLTFKSGKKLTFDYAGNPTRIATVTSGTGTHTGRVAATAARLGGGPALTRTAFSDGSEQVEYIDPDGSRM
jgi:hypothetical protein